MTVQNAQGTFKKVIIVGGGPSGMLLALLLGRQGVPVQLLEAAEKLSDAPRATHYAAAATYEFHRAGVLDEIIKQGIRVRTTCWRKLDGTYLAGLDSHDIQDYPYPLVCLPVDKVSIILSKDIDNEPSIQISYSHKVTGVGQDEQTAWVDVDTPKGTLRLEADYVIGCDGANSQVRRSMFVDKAFPGKTWDEQIVATNTYYDFKKYGYEDTNFIVHPEHWYMAARISNDGLWRVSYGEIPGLSNEELLARQPKKFEQMLPGHPKPGDYKITNISPYRIHQRLAKEMRVGRIILAADAAHLCNPFGGLGLTGGIVDVGGLYECLIGIYRGEADSSILDKYNEVRKQKYVEVADPISSDNIRRLFDQDPDKAMETDLFLQMCQRGETDKKLSREIQLKVNDLRYDFTQHYKKQTSANSLD